MPKGVYTRPSEETRFLRWVNKTDGCWLWTGTLNTDGYGVFHCPEKTAHRFSYRFHNNTQIPDGLMVLHSCDVRHCCNPDHLRVGTAKDNMMDCINRGRYKQPTSTWKKGDQAGENNTTAILDWEKVRQIRQRHSNGLKYGELKKMAEEYGIAYITMQKIVANKLWVE